METTPQRGESQSKRALITGVNGQDGSYMADLLLSKGYEVHGTIRRASTNNLQRIKHLQKRIHLHYADLSDTSSLHRALYESDPYEVYNLGAMSDVRVSFDVPEYCGQVTGLGPLRLLEAIRLTQPSSRFIKFYQAGSSEMFGMNPNVPCNEESDFYPGSPYAAAKVYAHNVVKNYREAFDMFAVNGILFNHEGPRRGEEFVTRKISKFVAELKVKGNSGQVLKLGDLAPKRDWGFANEYMDAVYRMMQQDEPDDYVLATGETHSVLEFVQAAFEIIGEDWRNYVHYDPVLVRPTDPPVLLGDASKAHDKLGWRPSTTFKNLVDIMVHADIAELTS